MPSLIDPSVAPPGHHVVHAFTADWIDNWQSLSAEEYERRKEDVADQICSRIEKAILPGLRGAIRLCEVWTPRHIHSIMPHPCTYSSSSGPGTSCMLYLHSLQPWRPLLLQVGTPRTHRRYLGRDAGTYGPIPSRRPLGMVGMPFNRTSVQVSE